MVNEQRFIIRVKEYYINRDVRNLRLTVPATITPNEFIYKILHNMTRESLLNIYRLSLVQYCINEDQVIPFINECRGELNINSSDHLSLLFNTIRMELLEQSD